MKQAIGLLEELTITTANDSKCYFFIDSIFVFYINISK